MLARRVTGARVRSVAAPAARSWEAGPGSPPLFGALRARTGRRSGYHARDVGAAEALRGRDRGRRGGRGARGGARRGGGRGRGLRAEPAALREDRGRAPALARGAAPEGVRVDRRAPLAAE